MTSGIGNPDWQRRYTFSAVPLYTASFPDSGNNISPLIDSNGYQYLMVTTNSGGSNTFDHVKLDWFQDANAVNSQGDTDYTIQGQTFTVQKIPVATRYFKLEIGPVGGVAGGSIIATVYGSNADQENLMTQDTSVPQGYSSGSVGAGVIQTTVIPGTFGGVSKISIYDATNNKWRVWLEYYDWTSQTWKLFWLATGADKGTAYAEYVNLPYAPCRFNVNNTDTVANSITVSVINP